MNTVTQTRIVELVQMIRAEYDEMPGLCLTPAQAQRLWVLDSAICDHVFRAMVDAGYLRSTPQGYVRT